MAACCLLPVGHAAENAAGGPLSLREAIGLALERNPDLASFAFELRARDARIDVAKLRPGLEAGLHLENFAGTGRASGVPGAELTLGLSGIVELGGQRERRVDAARLARDAVLVERQVAQLDVLAELARRFIHVAADQQHLVLTRLATQLAGDTVDEVERRVRAARTPEVELARARIALARARVEEEHAEHELLTSRRKLAAMWGAREAQFASVTADLFELPDEPDFEALMRRLGENPDFLRFASETRQREAELRVAEARARAAVSWNAGVRRLQREGEWAAVAGVSVPLFAAQRARGDIAEARAHRDAVAAREHSQRVRAEASLYELTQELSHAITETVLLRDEVMPQIEAALEATRYAWERGRYGYLEWTDAQRERIAVQRALIEAAANAHEFQIEIERLTGAPLAVPVSEELP